MGQYMVREYYDFFFVVLLYVVLGQFLGQYQKVIGEFLGGGGDCYSNEIYQILVYQFFIVG